MIFLHNKHSYTKSFENLIHIISLNDKNKSLVNLLNKANFVFVTTYNMDIHIELFLIIEKNNKYYVVDEIINNFKKEDFEEAFTKKNIDFKEVPFTYIIDLYYKCNVIHEEIFRQMKHSYLECMI